MARNKTITIKSGRGLDTSDFHDAAKALRKARKDLTKDMRKGLRGAGEIMAVEARKKAAEHSESIPPTVKVRVAGATVAVVAGGAKAPLAGLYELGNKGGSKSSATASKGLFRHPVFGNTDIAWVDQPRYPFMKAAAIVTLAKAETEIIRILDETTRTITEDYKHE